MKYIITNNNRQSLVLDFMRVPMIIIVLYMHIIPLDPISVSFDISWNNAYKWLSSLVSHNLGRAVVPCFFMLSGYFYFLKMQNWNTNFYIKQQKNRLKTLVLPYLIFNTLNILIVFIKGFVSSKISGGNMGLEDLQFLKENTLLDFYWFMPIDLPLWFLRDLIIMSFISPLFFYLFKYTKIVGLFLLALLYYSCVQFPIGFSTTAIMFFGCGAYMGIYKIPILNITNKYKAIVLPLSFISVLVSTYFSDSIEYSMIIERIYIPFGILSFIIISDILIDNVKLRDIVLGLTPSVFFIYSIHEFYLKNWMKGAFYRTPLQYSGLGMIIGYLLMPAILFLICLAIYKTMNKIMPKTLKIMCGNR